MNPFNKILTVKSEVIQLIQSSIELENEVLITYFNQHCFNKWHNEQAYRKLLENEFKYYFDGFGVWLALILLRRQKIKIFNATEIYNELFDELKQKQIPIIIIGGNFSQSILNYTELNIELYLNGYTNVKDFENILGTLTQCKSKLLIIGMGVPLQEELAYNISRRISGLQIICVGNFLEFLFGTVKRSPRIFHNSGFEWVFRLLTEPKRLWRRYILGIPKFIWLTFLMIINKNSIT